MEIKNAIIKLLVFTYTDKYTNPLGIICIDNNADGILKSFKIKYNKDKEDKKYSLWINDNTNSGYFIDSEHDTEYNAIKKANEINNSDVELLTDKILKWRYM